MELLGKDQQEFNRKTDQLQAQILEVDTQETRAEKAFELLGLQADGR